MTRTFRIAAMRMFILAVSLFLSLIAAQAQRSRGAKLTYEIKFKPGAKTATVEERVGPPFGEGDMLDPGVERYSLRVRAGQWVDLKITSDEDRAKFTLVTSDDKTIKNAAGVKRWSGRLRKSGNYFIIVFSPEAPANFKLVVTRR